MSSNDSIIFQEVQSNPVEENLDGGFSLDINDI